MLVLTRKLEEQIRIGDDITISILRVKGNTVRVGIEAPRAVRVVRGELPPHAPVDATADMRSEATCDVEVEVSESSSEDDGTISGEASFADPATTAVRQFLASRARRRNSTPKPHRFVDRAAATAVTRSA